MVCVKFVKTCLNVSAIVAVLDHVYKMARIVKINMQGSKVQIIETSLVWYKHVYEN